MIFVLRGCRVTNTLTGLFPGTVTFSLIIAIHHFTVACLVAWPLNESEAGVDLALIETSLLFLC